VRDKPVVFKKGAVLECTGCPDSSEAEYHIKGAGGFFCEKCKEKYIKENNDQAAACKSDLKADKCK